MDKKKKRYLLVDGNSLAYRAYYAFIRNPLFDSQGNQTSVLYGFFRMLFKAIKDLKPTHLAVFFDVSRKSFRTELYSEYKAQRKPTPPELIEQLKRLKESLKKMGITVIEQENFEADDLIASFCQRKTDGEFFILTGDKDYLQLINEKTKIILTKKGISDIKKYDLSEFEKDYSPLTPENITDLKGLMGDQSDNIPGAKGIGEKTALKLLKKYQNIENLYQNLDTLTPSQRKKLEESKDMVFLSKRLATMEKGINFDLEEKEMEFSLEKNENLFPVLESLEFHSLLKEINLTSSAEDNQEFEVEIIDEKRWLQILKEDLVGNKQIFFDTETDSSEPIKAELLGIAISDDGKKIYYLPLLEKDKEEISSLLSSFKDFLEKEKPLLIGHNLKYDLFILSKYNFPLLEENIFDTMLASYLLNPEWRRHGLDELAQKYFSYTKISYDSLLKDGGKRKVHQTLKTVPLKKVAQYCGEDVFITSKLYFHLKPQLKEKDLLQLYGKIEIKLLPILLKMEKEGIKLDLEFMEKLKKEFQQKLERLKEEIYAMAGEEFNIDSTKQLSFILFDKLGLPPLKKTKTGYSTDSSVLEELSLSFPIAQKILEYRSLAKLLNTYVIPLPQMVNPETSRIHTSFNQTVTATGRLSSSNPNLQNIPVKDEQGEEIRRAFIAEKGNLLVSLDYSQIELRVLAHFSQNEEFIQAFKEGKDIHTITAQTLFQTDKIEPFMRRIAKTVNFGIIYGQSPFGLSRELHIPVSDARNFIEGYFEKYPAISKFIEQEILEVKTRGYALTIAGRKRKVPELFSKNKNLQKQGIRIAINTKIQGSAADIIKTTMILVDEYLKKEKFPVKMLLQVHDELIFEIKKDKKMKKIILKIKELMENPPFQLRVPLRVDVKMGENWKEMEKKEFNGGSKSQAKTTSPTTHLQGELF